MPYILKSQRGQFKKGIYALKTISTPGELNYVITSIIHNYINGNIGINYTKINDAIGALECAKLELYRRKIASYEDKKSNENGDVE